MRRRHILLLAVASSVVVPSSVVLPVVSLPVGGPHAVAAEIHRALVHGVDAAATKGAPRALTEDGRPSHPVVLTAPSTVASFSTVGVTWRPGSAAAGTVVQTRVRTQGRWTSWSQLDVNPPGSGDPASASGAARRDGTEPLYVGPSDGYQVQVSSPSGRSPLDVQVVAVDPGSSTADADAASGGGAPLSTAAAEGSRPTFRSRAAWGAKESMRNCAPTMMTQVKATVVHHTDSSNGYSRAAVPAMIRGVYAYHTNGLGWCDIAYNVLVDRFGTLWEGRYGGLDRAVMSAATGGFNTYTSAISALGNFQTAAAPAVMVTAIARFVSWKLGLYRISPAARTSLVSGGGSYTKYRSGTVVPLPTVFGHRDSDQTSCPGRNLYAQLRTIRAKAFAYSGPSLFSPRLNYSRVTTGDFVSFVVNAGTRGFQRWQMAVYPSGSNTAIWAGGGYSVGNRLSAIWPRTTTAGRPVGAGTYGLVLTSGTARTWTGAVSVTGSTVIPPGDPKPALASVYTTPGSTISAGREWRTSCRAYSSTARRCITSLYVSWIQRSSTGYRTVAGWRTNNVTFMDQGNLAWAGNRLARPGSWTSAGRRWLTTCGPSTSQGPRQCRANIWSTGLRWSRGHVVQYQGWAVNSVIWLGDGR